ncbi:hypothetical protein [Streptomyces scabichelini]|uniref:hypothetical protein n=1 Tax=Streptomyces scabichelini TaxID=2711217 RepID=UPI0019D20694|nr:hypothetical protein [Streptomyces scabichelini]
MSNAARVPLGAALLIALVTAAVPSAAAAPHAPRVERVSTAADGTQADGASTAASITPTGRSIGFRSSAANLVPGNTRLGTHSYVRDLRTGRVQHFSGARARAVSPDGRQLLYVDGQSALHLRDLRTGADRTVAAAGTQASAIAGALSDRGVSFASAAPDLVPGDTNGGADVFVRRVH